MRSRSDGLIWEGRIVDELLFGEQANEQLRWEEDFAWWWLAPDGGEELCSQPLLERERHESELQKRDLASVVTRLIGVVNEAESSFLYI